MSPTINFGPKRSSAKSAAFVAFPSVASCASHPRVDERGSACPLADIAWTKTASVLPGFTKRCGGNTPPKRCSTVWRLRQAPGRVTHFGLVQSARGVSSCGRRFAESEEECSPPWGFKAIWLRISGSLSCIFRFARRVVAGLGGHCGRGTFHLGRLLVEVKRARGANSYASFPSGS